MIALAGLDRNIVHKLNSEEQNSRDLNLGLLGGKKECFLCAGFTIAILLVVIVIVLIEIKSCHRRAVVAQSVKHPELRSLKRSRGQNPSHPIYGSVRQNTCTQT